MSAILYFKRYQCGGIYHYGKLWLDRVPPLCEVLNFLSATPIIEQREYDLLTISDQIDYKALFESWELIDEREFQRAYKRATARDFEVYVNGKPI